MGSIIVTKLGTPAYPPHSDQQKKPLTSHSSRPTTSHVPHPPTTLPPISHIHRLDAPRTTTARSSSSSRRHIGLDDLIQLETLGTGTFGRVKLVALRNSPQKFYALKSMKKQHILKTKQVQHVKNERQILMSLNHPFLVNLHGTFQDDQKVYLLMDFIQGGELFTYLRRIGRFPNDIAKFYAAQLVLIFEYLQTFHIAHRDLKPENLLLDTQGYLRLTDFGFAKVVTERAYTVCGTPEYLSPEMITSKGHNCGTDWWSLGIFIYELLVGRTPFYADSQFQIYERILAGRVRYPEGMHPDAKDLIRQLLTADRTSRLGMMKGGAEDIKRHRWFNGVDWQSLLRKEITAPIQVRFEGPGDIRNFQRYAGSVDLSEGPALPAEQQALFSDF